MNAKWILPILTVFAAIIIVGCGNVNSQTAKKEEGKKDDKAAAKKDEKSVDPKEAKAEFIRASLAKLSPEDRKIAEAQKYCAVENDNPLGIMDVPVKLTIKGQSVFICCKSCLKEAEANPDQTIAKVEKLKAKVKEEMSKKA